MIRNCPNCASKIVYDISLGALSCDKCGGIYDVEEFDAMYGIPDDEDIVPAEDAEKSFIDNELIKEAHKKMMDVSIFNCSSCGGEIIVSSTEASTFCIYCGNPNIVFSRIKKINRPDAIIPFSIPKEVAEVLLRTKLKKGLFVPKAIKNFNTDSLVGIYVPYHINNIRYRDTFSMEYYVEEGNGRARKSVRKVFYISGECVFDRLTTDACTNLNDELTYHVEPYDVVEAVPFENEYLLGFYSDIPDVSFDEAFNVACKKAKDVIYDDIQKRVDGSRKKILMSDPQIENLSEPLLALMPMWFLSYTYKGQKYTSVINGQTGKIVGGVPIDKFKFITSAILVGLLSFILAVFIGSIIPVTSDSIQLNVYCSIIALASITYGVTSFIRAKKALMRSSSNITRLFATKRQGGQ